jgi:hypothetical protein
MRRLTHGVLGYLISRNSTVMITYEHIGQFLSQVNDVRIIDVHKVRLFPLSLSDTTFNWFTCLAPNSVDTWPSLRTKIP